MPKSLIPIAKMASVKVSEQLLDRLKDAQYAQRKSGEDESTYAELLDQAWVAFTSTGTCELSGNEDSVAAFQTRDISCSSVDVQDRDATGGISPWVAKAEEILRSGNAVIVEALQKNLLAFGLILGLIDEQSGHSHTIPGANSDGEIAEALGAKDRAVAREKRTAGGAGTGSIGGSKGDKRAGGN